MVVVHHHTLRNQRMLKSYAELDSWLSAAHSVLEGNEGNKQGQKQAKIHYQWIDWLNRGPDGHCGSEERFVAVHVE